MVRITYCDSCKERVFDGMALQYSIKKEQRKEYIRIDLCSPQCAIAFIKNKMIQ